MVEHNALLKLEDDIMMDFLLKLSTTSLLLGLLTCLCGLVNSFNVWKFGEILNTILAYSAVGLTGLGLLCLVICGITLIWTT